MAEKKIDSLTAEMEACKTEIQIEHERGRRIESIMQRLAQAEADRQVQLRAYERGLDAVQDPTVRSLLDTVIPSSVLDGLRSRDDTGCDARGAVVPCP